MHGCGFGFLFVLVGFLVMARVIRVFARLAGRNGFDPVVDGPGRSWSYRGRLRRRRGPPGVCADPYCGRVNHAQARFCGQCGKRLPGSR